MQTYSIASNEQGIFIYINTSATTKEQVDSIIHYIGTCLEHDEEREDWLRYTSQNLERAYGDDEPDYSNVPALKVNPFFRH